MVNGLDTVALVVVDEEGTVAGGADVEEADEIGGGVEGAKLEDGSSTASDDRPGEEMNTYISKYVHSKKRIQTYFEPLGPTEQMAGASAWIA